MTIDKKIIDKLMKDYQSPEDIFGKDGVFKRSTPVQSVTNLIT